MDTSNTKLGIDAFYPNEIFEITNCDVTVSGIVINLKARKQECECPQCHQVSKRFHATYKRSAQDLPVLGKNTTVVITAHEYECQNEECPAKTIVDHFDHFLGYYGRYTERCEDLIVSLALETSCEGASHICEKTGIHISGDTIIRILKKRYAQMEVNVPGSCIGVDDFSTKKGNTYCTVVCDGDSHQPVAVLNGRDGASFKEWLHKNQHVRMITRDRASAYAKVIKEELPDAMQIADRFHLHQNLLDAIKKCIASELPQNLKVQIGTGAENDDNNMSDNDSCSTKTESASKKNACECG